MLSVSTPIVVATVSCSNVVSESVILDFVVVIAIEISTVSVSAGVGSKEGAGDGVGFGRLEGTEIGNIDGGSSGCEVGAG